MAIAFVNKGVINGPLGGGGTVTKNFAGVNFIVASLASVNGSSGVLTDDQTNTYSTLTRRQSAFNSDLLTYAINPTVSSSLQFTSTGAAPQTCIAGFSGCDTSSPLDTSNGTFGDGVANLQYAASLTPGGNGYLVVATIGLIGTDTPSIADSSFSAFTSSDLVPGDGVSTYGGGLAYEIQGTATARQPIWTWGGGSQYASINLASFKVFTGSGFQAAWAKNSNVVSMPGYQV